MIRVVLDTNVLVSANLNKGGLEALVLSFALNHKFRLYISREILSEYERVIFYPRLKLDPDEIRQFLKRVRLESRMVNPRIRITASPDEAGNRFLECAEAGKVDFLVTGNRRHFPKSWLKTQVVNTSELLAQIGSVFQK